MVVLLSSLRPRIIISIKKHSEYLTNGQVMMAEGCEVFSCHAIELLETEYKKISTVNNQNIIPADTRCNCFISVSYDIQCVHELLNDDGFNIKKWGTSFFNSFAHEHSGLEEKLNVPCKK